MLGRRFALDICGLTHEHDVPAYVMSFPSHQRCASKLANDVLQGWSPGTGQTDHTLSADLSAICEFQVCPDEFHLGLGYQESLWTIPHSWSRAEGCEGKEKVTSDRVVSVPDESLTFTFHWRGAQVLVNSFLSSHRRYTNVVNEMLSFQIAWTDYGK